MRFVVRDAADVAIVLKRVIDANRNSLVRYKQQLLAKAATFGLDPRAIDSMNTPVLVRQTMDPGLDAQRAIRDFNESGTARLTPAEQALSDSTRVSQGTLERITDRIEEGGERATLASLLDTPAGPQLIEDLIEDGAINRGEKAGLLDQDGRLTSAAKDRVAKTVLGRVFRDTEQFKNTLPSRRRNLERALPHIIRTEARGDDWNLLPEVQEAIDVLEFARGTGVNLVDLPKQKSTLSGNNRPRITRRNLALADKLSSGPIKAAKAFRQYANEADLSRPGSSGTFFDPPTPAEAFEAAFGRVSAKLDAADGEARGRLKDILDDESAELRVDDLIELARIGAVKLARGVRNFAKFSAEMLAEFGERVRPHLRNLFDRAKQLVAELRRDTRGGLRRRAKKGSPDERQGGLFSAAEEAVRGKATQRFKAETSGKQLSAEFGTKSAKRLDRGKKPIADAPLFGGEPQIDLFGPEKPTPGQLKPTHPGTNVTVQSGKLAEFAPKAGVKQPWQMTKAEWGEAFDKARPDPAGTGGGPAIRATTEKGARREFGAMFATQDHLKMGLPDRVVGEGMKAPARHRQVVEAALEAGFPVPSRALEGYPDLMIDRKRATLRKKRKPRESVLERFERGFGDESGSLTVDLATLGTAKFVKQEVVPTAKQACAALCELGDDALRIFAPTARAPSAKQGGLILRERLAVMQRKFDRAEFALRKARAHFDGQPDDANADFIGKIESGDPQGDADLDGIAGALRNLLDGRRRDVQALGSGKLQTFNATYFPHIWKQRRGSPGQGHDDDVVFKQIFGRRPLEGPKAFLKRRTLPTFADGLDVGLEPVTFNPIDLTLLKIREMDRYLMAHETLRDFREAGIAQFVPAEKHGRIGWIKIADPIGTVYGRPAVDVDEFFDRPVMNQLNALARGLGFKVERVAAIKEKPSAAGVAYQGTGRIKTRFGSPWDVLAHELGHQLDWKFGLMGRLMRGPPKKPLKETKPERIRRVELNKQLRALADLRFEGSLPEPAFQRYVRKRAEKGAAVVQAYLYAPDKMRSVAPDVYAEFEGFIADHAELHPLRDIKPSLVLGTDSMEFRLQGLLVKGHWYAPEPAAVVLNNHLTPGLRSRSGLFRAALGVNNVMNQAQLGMSAFHLTNTAIDAVTSQYALAIQQASQGRPVRCCQSLLKTTIAPIANVVQGGRLINEWYKPGGGGGEIASIMEGLTIAGGRVKMDRAFQTTYRRQFMGAMRQGNIIGGVLRLPLAAIETASWPIMEFVVPRMKMGVFMQLARSELERMGPNARREDVRARLAAAWDVVDDRLGEVVYDNLFWNRWAKDIAMITARSVGWNWGTWRVIFGGAVDLGAQTARGARRLVGKGKVADNSREGLTFRASYLIGFTTMTAAIGAITHMLLTGEQPETVEDYFFPRTGELDDNGKPRRVTLPTYMKDVFHLWADPIGTVANKASPLLDLTTDMLSNRDFFGTEIRNTDEPVVQQLIDLAKHVGSQGFTPFGITGLRRARDQGLPLQEQLLPFVGLVPPARKSISSPTERFLLSVLRAKGSGQARTRVQSDRARLRSRITGRMRAQLRGIPRGGPTAGELSGQGISEGTLTPQDLTRAVQNAGRSPLVGLFERVSLDDAIKAFELADPDERRILQPLLIKKIPSIVNRPRRELLRSPAP